MVNLKKYQVKKIKNQKCGTGRCKITYLRTDGVVWTHCRNAGGIHV